MKALLVTVVALLAVSAGIGAWVGLHRSTTVGSSAFVCYVAPTPTPTPTPLPTGSPSPADCRSGDADGPYRFLYLLAKEGNQSEAMLQAHQYSTAVHLARDAEVRLAMCSASTGNNPTLDVLLAKLQVMEAEAYIGYGDDRGAPTLGEAEATAESVEHSIDADASTKRSARQISDQIANDMARLSQ